MKSKLYALLVFSYLALCSSLLVADAKWIQQNSGIGSHILGVDFVNYNTGFAVGDSALILRTTNAGVNWVRQQNPAIYDLRSVCFVNALTGTAVGGGGIILRTTNAGINWVLQNSGTNENLNGVSFFGPDIGTAVGGFVFPMIFHTSDRGETWVQQYPDMPFYTSWLNGVYLTGTLKGHIVGGQSSVGPPLHYSTTNGGNNWLFQPINGAATDLYGVSFINVNTGFVVGYVGICKTTTAGYSWVPVGGGYLKSISFSDTNNGTAVGILGMIKHTTNGGLNWYDQNSGTSQHLNGVKMLDSITGFAVGNFGVILHCGPSIGIRKISTKVPQSFHLYQNYPNPFNPITQIRFEMPKDEFITIKVYDALGREVSILLNERKSAGSYTVYFDASNLPSGVYFYKLRTGDYTESKKMVLMK